MKTLIILGSPRKNGNSETLAQTVAGILTQAGEEVEYVRLNRLKIKPCQACDGCHKDGNCVIKDDMTPLYDKVDLADRLIVTSPVYFYAVSAQLKLFIDRCQARWSRKFILNTRLNSDQKRTGHLLSVAATSGEKLFDGPQLTVKYLCDALDLEEGPSLLIRGADQKNSCRNTPENLEAAVAFARKLLGPSPDFL